MLVHGAFPLLRKLRREQRACGALHFQLIQKMRHRYQRRCTTLTGSTWPHSILSDILTTPHHNLGLLLLRTFSSFSFRRRSWGTICLPGRVVAFRSSIGLLSLRRYLLKGPSIFVAIIDGVELLHHLHERVFNKTTTWRYVCWYLESCSPLVIQDSLEVCGLHNTAGCRRFVYIPCIRTRGRRIRSVGCNSGVASIGVWFYIVSTRSGRTPKLRG